MMFDMNEVSMIGGILTFPDYPFSVLPTPDSEIRETIRVTGTSATSPGVTGTVDD